jgi:DNA mismatch repair ATPase MutS
VCARHRTRSSVAQCVPGGLPLVKVSLQVHEDILLLDYSTVQTLELIENTNTGLQRSGSLFACINKTKTAMGARLLRSSLLQPLKNPDIINARLDAVDQLAIHSTELYHGLQRALDSFPDLERVSSNLLVKSKVIHSS